MSRARALGILSCMESMDLALRVEWLEQALAAIEDEGALARLRSLVRALGEIQSAIAHVEQRSMLVDAFIEPLRSSCDRIAGELESMAGSLRRGQPTSIVFSHEVVNRSYARFARLMEPIQRNAHEGLDELFWATEWLHVSLGHLSGN